MLYARGRRLREGCHGRCRKRGSGIAAVRAMGASRVCRDLGSRPASRFRSIRFQRKRSTPARAGWRRERSKFRLRTDRSRPTARCRERADRFRPSLSSRRYSAFTSTSRTFADAWLSSAISRSRPSYMRDKATRRRSATSRSSWRKSYPKCRMLSRCRISMRPWPLPRRRGAADTSKLAITGLCRGGRTVWLYAAHNPAVKAAVSSYGHLELPSSELQPKSPIDLAADLKAPPRPLWRRRHRHQGRERREDKGSLQSCGQDLLARISQTRPVLQELAASHQFAVLPAVAEFH
jgi:hypothetical protein